MPNHQPKNNISTTLDIIDIIKLLWCQKSLIIGVIIVAATLSIITALFQEEIYMAELKAMPSEASLTSADNSLQATIALRLKGFGNAVGEYEKHLVAVQVLRSRSFIQNFIKRHQLKPLLYGVKGWDVETNSLLWHEQIYNPQTEQWTTSKPPTLQDATRDFFLNNLLILDDRNSRVLTIRIFHHSPMLASQWANWLIHDLNEHMKNKELTETTEILSFYQHQLAITLNQNTRNMLREQIEQTTYKKLVADSQGYFLFEVIDPPLVPDKRAYPRRGLLVILGTFLGGILALVLAFMKVLIAPPLPRAEKETENLHV